MQLEKRLLILAPFGSNLGEGLKAQGLLGESTVVQCHPHEWGAPICAEIAATTHEVVSLIIMDRAHFAALNGDQLQILIDLAPLREEFRIMVFVEPPRTAPNEVHQVWPGFEDLVTLAMDDQSFYN